MSCRVAWLWVAGLCAALVGCHDEHWLTYPWDDRGVLCSQPVDDLDSDVPWDLVEDQMAVAQETESVLLLHAHVPGKSVSVAAIERVISKAEAHQLAFLTFRDLDPAAPHRAGLALAFDDDKVDAWTTVRPLLASHAARVTFFVTRFAELGTDQLAELEALASDGHDLEPHSAQHLLAPTYVAEHGVAAYLADEFQPSVDALIEAGYPPATAYAYPFGRNTAELDAAILEVVRHVRVSPGACPY
jgi:peptidoglycan/xylan/chitin deacetylase (PgdA/CDA1 family)